MAVNVTVCMSGGDFRIHKTGCRDIARAERRREHRDPDWTVDVDTLEDIARDVWHDQMTYDVPPMSLDDALDNITVLPCAAKHLKEAAR